MSQWRPQYPVDFAPDGDLTNTAIQKIINEFSLAVYPFLNRLRTYDAGPTPPTDPVENSFWLDTSAVAGGGNAVLKRYTGGEWVSDVAIPNAEYLGGYTADDLLSLAILRANPIVDAPFPFGAHPAGFTLKTYSAGETTIDWNYGNKQLYILSGSKSLSFVNPPFATNLVFMIKHAVTGANITWPANVKWNDKTPPDFTDAYINRVDIVTFFFDGTYYYGMAAYDFGV
jgi:hypothetical protein